MKKKGRENNMYEIQVSDELDLIKLKAQIKAILAEPSKLQRIAKLLEEK